MDAKKWMTLDKKFHKTGGSHIHFHSLGIICDKKSPVRSAALPGDFFTFILKLWEEKAKEIEKRERERKNTKFYE